MTKTKIQQNKWPEKCPITRRDFFMEIDGVPTYGGPYDSYTIPEMEGTPDQPWHDRELTVRRYDHDRGCWWDYESIPMRIIHEDVLAELEGKAEAGFQAGVKAVADMIEKEAKEYAIEHGHEDMGLLSFGCSVAKAEHYEALIELSERVCDMLRPKSISGVQELGLVTLLGLSADALESLYAMVDYCINHGIAMGMDGGFKSFEPEQKHSFRLELEALCEKLAASLKSDSEG